MIRPVGSTVSAEPVQRNEQTKGGLFLPGHAAKDLETKVAKVIAVGPDAKRAKVGDTILYKPYATFDVKLKDCEYVLVEDEDILAVVDDHGQQPG